MHPAHIPSPLRRISDKWSPVEHPVAKPLIGVGGQVRPVESVAERGGESANEHHPLTLDQVDVRGVVAPRTLVLVAEFVLIVSEVPRQQAGQDSCSGLKWT